MDILHEILKPQFLVMILAFISVFVAAIAFVTPAMREREMEDRMQKMLSEQDTMRNKRLVELGMMESSGLRIETKEGLVKNVVDSFGLDRLLAEEEKEMRNKMAMAGMRGEGPYMTYVFFRFTLPVVVLAIAIIFVLFIADMGQPVMVRLMMAGSAAGLSFYLPGLYVNSLVERRQEKIRHDFPDVLDLLLICVQSGMSIEAALRKVTEEADAESEISEELALTVAELSYLSDKRQALENLAARTGVPEIKSMTTTLAQAEKYGTPLGDALRVLAREGRESRMARAEAKAAALGPKMTIPMVVFFLPTIFVITMGPVGIQFTEKGIGGVMGGQ
jgi:tight adherence protein C